MRWGVLSLLLIGFIFTGCKDKPKTQPETTPVVKIPEKLQKPKPSSRSRIIAVAQKELGTTEKTGKNDGRCEVYLASVGLGKGYPYCAAGIYWTYKEALSEEELTASGIPKTAWSPSMAVSPVLQGSSLSNALPGDVLSLYWNGRVRHVGLVEIVTAKAIQTIEYNTSQDARFGSVADADGGGVFRRYRLKSQVYGVKQYDLR